MSAMANLSQRLDDLLVSLVPLSQYDPLVRAEVREGWANLPRSARDRLIAQAQDMCGRAWPVLPATLYMEFQRNGNRTRYEAPYFARRQALVALVLGECAEYEGKFLDEIINMAQMICEETSWVLPAHNAMDTLSPPPLPDVDKPELDLFACETGGLLSWTLYLLGRALAEASPVTARRMEREVEKRILDPFLMRDDFWWMGNNDRTLNNWTPWCVSNVLSCALLMERSEKHRWQAVKRCAIFLDRYLQQMPEDGGCDEGPGYWVQAAGAALDCLELIYSASRGRVNGFEMRKVRNMGTYILGAHIARDRYVNFADAAARVSVPGALVYRYGRMTEIAELKHLGAWLLREQQNEAPTGSLMRRAMAALLLRETEAAEPVAPLPLQSWWPDLQMMTARSLEGSDRGWFLAVKGGHNAESHNHNDVGNLIVAYNGETVLCDVGVESYTKKTFSARRYEIWTMQSAYHNLPTLRGHMQQAGREYAAEDVRCDLAPEYATLSLNIAPAYPRAAGIQNWQRTVTLSREGSGAITIFDMFDMGRTIGDVSLSFMTPFEPVLSGQQVALGPVTLEWDAPQLVCERETIEIEDARLKDVWGHRLFRIVLSLPAAVLRGNLSFRLTPRR